MSKLEFFALTQIHMDATGQARIKTAHYTHNVDAFEILRAILLEDWRVLYRIFVGTRSPIDVTWAGIPGSWWIRMVIGNFSILNHHVMRKHASHCLVETAADGLFGHRKITPGLGIPGMNLSQSPLDAIESNHGCICLEIGTRPVALNGVAP